MVIQQFTSQNRTTINWASGTSTELFIYPSTGNFAERDFLFRISTATVEAEESTFTIFEGITRHLMILKGDLELIHKERYTKQLKPFDQDTFNGEWKTRSKGKVTDFNLMLKGGAAGSLTHQQIEANDSAQFRATAPFYFLYFATGKASLSTGNQANAGDLIQLEKNATLTIQALERCDLIEVKVSV